MGEQEVEDIEVKANGKSELEDVNKDELEDVTIEVIYPEDEIEETLPPAKKAPAVAKAKQKANVQASAEEKRTPAPTAKSSESVADTTAPDIQLSEFQQQIDSLTREKNNLYDQLLRRAAEFENFRKRTEREKTENYNRARADVILELLPVIDNFERALSSLEKSVDDAQGLRHGIELIHKQFKDALTKFGLQEVEAIGKIFDPNLHEAVTIEATDEHEENTVIEEFERGYKLGDRLLRPAKVKVAASPDNN